MRLDAKIRQIIATVLDIPEQSVRLDASLKDDLGATSLDRYTILMDIEEAFSLDLDDVPEQELEENIANVDDIIAFVKKRTEPEQ
jgi:acyl carrier protein